MPTPTNTLCFLCPSPGPLTRLRGKLGIELCALCLNEIRSDVVREKASFAERERLGKDRWAKPGHYTKMPVKGVFPQVPRGQV